MFFFDDTATTEIYTYCHTLSLHDALPIYHEPAGQRHLLGEASALGPDRVLGDLADDHLLRLQDLLDAQVGGRLGAALEVLRVVLDVSAVEHGVLGRGDVDERRLHAGQRSEEHTSELQSLMRISYAVFCLKQKN